MCAYTHGVGHTGESAQHFDSETHRFFLCSGRYLNIWSWNPLDFEADVLPIEPPRPRYSMTVRQTADNTLDTWYCCAHTWRYVYKWQTCLSFGIFPEASSLALACRRLRIRWYCFALTYSGSSPVSAPGWRHWKQWWCSHLEVSCVVFLFSKL